MPFLRNAWYMAAWDTELEPGAMLKRHILSEPILLLRDSDGVAHAMMDRCPHRFAPLSMGQYDGGTVQCRYHGLRFNGEGKCVLNPHGPIPGASTLKTYPLIERDYILWIWMGDPAQADDGLVPDYSFQDPANYYAGKEYLHVNTDYRLEIDNILDLSHIEFLHGSSLGSDAVSKGSYKALQEGDVVWSNREIKEEQLPPEVSSKFGLEPGKPSDRYLNVRWTAPGNLALFSRIVPAGADAENAPVFGQAHLFTPESEASTHYWFSLVLPKAFGPGAEQAAKSDVEFLRKPFAEEDLPMLEAQQRLMTETNASMAYRAVLSTDAGGMRAQRVLDRLIRAEQEGSTMAAQSALADA